MRIGTLTIVITILLVLLLLTGAGIVNMEHKKSYIENATSELTDYKEQYLRANDYGKMIIKESIKSKFKSLDVNKIKKSKIRSFLIETRGY